MSRNYAILLALIGCYVVPAAALWPSSYATLLQSYVAQMIVIPIILLIALPLSAVIAYRKAPFSYMRDLARSSLLRFAVVAIVFCAGVAAFTTYKLAIPSIVPFYADPFFADLDLLIHGVNPGEWAHANIPAFARYPLGVLYGPVWFMLWFGLLAFVALHENAALRRQYFWGMALTIALMGTVAATAMSSVGPVFYERIYGDDRFAALMGIIGDSPIGDYMAEATGYLYLAFTTGSAELGTGISAMPSMHLAIVTLNALMLSRVSRVLGTAAWIYTALIQLGSVFLGWHYAIDGYFSIAAVAGIWVVAGRLARLADSPARDPAVARPSGPSATSEA